jgi:uncharacterized OsmC-like protein
MHFDSNIRQRQATLARRYREHPEDAMVAKRARTVPQPRPDPLHVTVTVDGPYPTALWALGIDDKVGGESDLPNPAEMLLASLAGCQESTLRMVAENLGIEITSLEVVAHGQVDARGCLALDNTVKVGFDSITVDVHLEVAENTDPGRLQQLRNLAERLCVTTDTLRNGVPIEISYCTT